MTKSNGEPISISANTINDCKKAKSVLGATIRPIEQTIRDIVESQIEFGVIKPTIR